MGTKYASQTISGYNATPPADDGTVSEANRVKWSTHKTKLSDPVKTLAEAINTAMVAHSDESVADKSVNYTTVAGDHKRVMNVTAAITISLGDATTMAAGYIVTVKNSHSAAITVDLATGTDELDGTVGGSVSIPAKGSFTFATTSAADGYLIVANRYNPLAESGLISKHIKASDESVSNSTTFQNDDDLTVELEANKTYKIEISMLFASSAVGTVQGKLIYTAPASCLWYANGEYHQSTGTGTGSSGHDSFNSSYTTRLFTLDDTNIYNIRHTILVKNGANAGTFALQYAQQVASAGWDLECKSGSNMQVYKLD